VNLSRQHVLTATIVVVAIVMVLLKYRDYVLNPWTRDGQVRAEVVQIAPRVSGPIVSLPVRDNQFVKAGDLLFEIDPRTYAASAAQAQAQYDMTDDNYLAGEKQIDASVAQVRQAQSSIKQLDAQIIKDKAEFERQQELLPKRATSQKSVDRAKANYNVSLQQREGAVASLAQAEATLAKNRATLGTIGDANASLRQARAELEQATLNLEFTRVLAPVDGYITNLNMRLGSQAVANQPALALVDINSYWVDAYFRETSVGDMRAGDKAIVTLMTYPDDPIEGHVDSLGWGISQQDGSTGFELLPTISPTFEWIRLAQRVPVRIQLDSVPEGVALRVGTTGSVLVKTGSGEEQ
jgi:multidrug resistance efflux pump